MSAIISSTSSASVNLIRVRFKSNNFSLAYSQYVWNSSLVNKTALFSFSARFLFGGNKSIRSDLNDSQSRCSGSQFSNHVEAVRFSTLVALATVSRPFHPNSSQIFNFAAPRQSTGIGSLRVKHRQSDIVSTTS
jgi:hypothetical protein